MRMQGRRESTHVRDVRGSRAKMAGGLGLGGLLLVALFAYMTGGNPLNAVLNAVVGSGGNLAIGQGGGSGDYVPTEEEEGLKRFASQILDGTEVAWSNIFVHAGMTYEPPTLVLFTGSIQSGCGGASKQVGPFYCSADKCLYIDLSFFSNMRDELGADGDFAYAYVIGHEVGHHVQHLLGTLDKAHKQMAQMNEEDANRQSVRIELQADFFAGVWAHYDDVRFRSLEDGDIEEGIDCARVIGDDYLQKKAFEKRYGPRVAVDDNLIQPEKFTHGTSEARIRWFKKGYDLKNLKDPTSVDLKAILEDGDTFSVPFDSL